MDLKPYGYYVHNGFLGRVGKNIYMLFPTYQEYVEYIGFRGDN